MSNSKLTKKALLSSLMALALCFAMLTGTTFAWFTDQETSANNKVIAGYLDVDLELLGEDGQFVSITEDESPIFNYEYWEPGYVDAKILKIVNKGNLALKWQAMFVCEKPLSILADVIDVYVCPSDTEISAPADRTLEGYTYEGTIAEYVSDLTETTKGELAPGEAAYLGIALKMREDAGNDYQGLDLCGTFDIVIVANQFTYEEDSFDNTYDEDTELPGTHNITNTDELEQVFSDGGNGLVMNDIGDVYIEHDAGTETWLNLNGNTLSGKPAEEGFEYVMVNNGTLTLTGEGDIVSNLKGSIENWGILSVNNIALEVTGEKYGFHCKSGEAEIKNLKLKAQRGGLNVQGGKLTINEGCEIEVDGLSNKVGYGIYAASDDYAEVIINDGKFTYNQMYTKYSVIYAGLNANVVINGGTFGKGGSGHKSGGWIRTADNGTVTIYGGTFEFDPSAFVAEGYEAIAGEDGWWTVSKIGG